MQSKLNTSLILTAACLAFLSGCFTQEYAGSTYDANHARQGHTIYTATITSIQNVKIKGEKGVLGTIGGGVLGGVLGNAIGGGSGKRIATAAGAVGGAVAGSAAESAANTHSALEITVEYPDGRSEAIVQQAGTDAFEVGQSVRVIVNRDGTKRVRP